MTPNYCRKNNPGFLKQEISSLMAKRSHMCVIFELIKRLIQTTGVLLNILGSHEKSGRHLLFYIRLCILCVIRQRIVVFKNLLQSLSTYFKYCRSKKDFFYTLRLKIFFTDMFILQTNLESKYRSEQLKATKIHSWSQCSISKEQTT